MDELRQGLVLPVRIDPTGRLGPTRSQARNPRHWERTSHGYYRPPGAFEGAVPVEQRIVDASVVVPPGGAITGWAALRWLANGWFDGTDASGAQLPVPILISTHDVRPQPGIAVSGEGTGPDEIVVVDGLRVTSPAWSTSFVMRHARSVQDAVIALDMAAYSDLVSIKEVADLVAGQSSWTGVPQARGAVALGSENAWSPAEVRMRLLWQAAFEGARPVANLPLFDLHGRHLGTPDLVDVAAGVLGEYDSVLHLDSDRRRADRSKDELYAEHGLQVVRWLSGDHPGDVLAHLHAAHVRAARWNGPRSWTADPPPGWTSTATVAARRALTAEQRSRFLRYRIA
ncbi:MAG TPA: hypothetical protein VNT31_03065 [Nocardioides sp.]|nr:hypothetical protein [Nocardioides sp.]